MRTNRAFRMLRLIALAMVLAGATGALAQDQGGDQGNNQGNNGGRGNRGNRRGGGDPQQMLDRLDTNKDGKITADEFQGPKDIFDRMDTNKDGAVTLEEMTAARQQRGQGGPGGGQGNFQDQMMNRYKERLGASDEEWTAMKPRLQKVMDLRQKTRGSMGGFRGGRGGPGGGNEDPNANASTTLPEATTLQKAVDDANTPADKLTAELKAYREARQKAETELQAAREDLRQILTARQEAILVLSGILD